MLFCDNTREQYTKNWRSVSLDISFMLIPLLSKKERYFLVDQEISPNVVPLASREFKNPLNMDSGKSFNHMRERVARLSQWTSPVVIYSRNLSQQSLRMLYRPVEISLELYRRIVSCSNSDNTASS